MSRRLLAICSCSFLMAACGGSSSTGDDDVGGVDAPVSATLDPRDCSGVAQNFAAAATTCGGQLPAGAEAAFKGFCERGVAAAAMCGGNPAGGLDCFVTKDATDWVCQLGQPYPACNGDLASALGMYCVIALGNPACASGIHCEFDTDCSGGLGCNGKTSQCFDKSAYCIGLPCEFNTDCPAHETCNGAEHVCVGQ
ncbi:MAG: uncharacterized protein H6Q90_631 [Deltaproteobacteria bacterium]|nr:uncharacterized protein [Deltaproteobacteria bacterium]